MAFGHIPGLKMHARHFAVIAGDEAVQYLGKKPPAVAVEAAGNAKVNADNRAVFPDQQIALMHVGMEKPVAQCMGQKNANKPRGDVGQVEPGDAQGIDIRCRYAVYPAHGQHAAARAFPHNIRHAKALIIARIIGHFLKRGGLAAQICFGLKRTRQRVNGVHRPQAAGSWHQLFNPARDDAKGCQIAGNFAVNARAQNFHRQFRVGRAGFMRLMHLRDGGRGKGRAHIFKNLFRLIQIGCDDAAHVGLGEGGQSVLQVL